MGHAGDQLAPELREYLDTISDSSRRMGMLIDDLLAFSRLGRKPLSRTRVDIVDLHESLWAATARFEDAPPGNEYEAWTEVRRTEFDVKTAACPALAPAIAAFVTTVESRLATFKAEPARAPHDQITSHARLVEVRATDANFVQMTLGSLSGGLDGLLVAADKITRAASACSGLPVRRLAPTAQDD